MSKRQDRQGSALAPFSRLQVDISNDTRSRLATLHAATGMSYTELVYHMTGVVYGLLEQGVDNDGVTVVIRSVPRQVETTLDIEMFNHTPR